MRARDNLARALTTLLPNNKVPNWVTYFGAEFLYTKGGDLEWFRSTDKVWAYKLQRSSWTRFVFAECFTRLRQVNKRTSSSRTNSRCLLWISEYWDDWMPTGRSIVNILLPLVSTSELSRVQPHGLLFFLCNRNRTFFRDKMYTIYYSRLLSMSVPNFIHIRLAILPWLTNSIWRR